jgi:hypothetical protein
MTVRIPEGAYELLRDLEMEDGVPPAIRARKMVLDHVQWWNHVPKRKARKTPARKSEPQVVFGEGDLPESLDAFLESRPDLQEKIEPAEGDPKPNRAERRRKQKGK